jgi:hypothetical protein
MLSVPPAGGITFLPVWATARLSAWHAEGSYEPIAEAFNQLNVDRFLLEFDSDRAGGFEPLRFMPKNKAVVLGLISSKEPGLEPSTPSADVLTRHPGTYRWKTSPFHLSAALRRRYSATC